MSSLKLVALGPIAGLIGDAVITRLLFKEESLVEKGYALVKDKIVSPFISAEAASMEQTKLGPRPLFQ